MVRSPEGEGEGEGEGDVEVAAFISSKLSALAPAQPNKAAHHGVTVNVGPGWTLNRTGMVLDMGRAWAKSAAERDLAEAIAGPNPWQAGHENRTR